MTREQQLRNKILDEYQSIRQFSIAANIPYSTIMTILSRGIGGASFDVVLNICKALNIDPAELSE